VNITLVGSSLNSIGGIPRYMRWLERSLRLQGSTTTVDLRLDGTLARRAAGVIKIGALLIRRPDVIVAGHASLWPIGIAARPLGVGFVIVAFGVEVWGPSDRRLSWGLRLADAVWPISSFTSEQLERLHGVTSMSEPLGGAIEGSFFQRRAEPDGTFKILVVTRVDGITYKGIDVCVAAAAQLAEDHRVELRIVGDGPDAAALRRLIADHRCARWLGRLSDAALHEEYRHASVVLLVSRFRPGPQPMGEGLGIALLEASASGVPVIGAVEGGSRDAVVDGSTGYLVEAGSVDALVTVLERLIDDPALQLELGEAGRSFVEQHHAEPAFSRRVGDALRSAAQRRRRRGLHLGQAR
jgi:phosphatidylinositol alpha-1,6-mannosyltransferase